jgi:hypothetical protein
MRIQSKTEVPGNGKRVSHMVIMANDVGDELFLGRLAEFFSSDQAGEVQIKYAEGGAWRWIAMDVRPEEFDTGQ